MASADGRARVAGLTILAIACVAMVATQLNYLIVGDAHMIVVLAPITACALLFGPVPAGAVGALAGAAELVHAIVLPLDYYEKYLIAPWNSIGLFGLTGLLMGLLFAWVNERGTRRGWQRDASLALCCAIGSAFFTCFFHQSTYLINSIMSYELPRNLLAQLTGSHEVFSQALANFGLMAMFSIGADHAVGLLQSRGSERTIRGTFQFWLGIVVLIAYMVSSAFAYTGVSIMCRGEAERTLEAQLTYLEDQLAAHDKMIEGAARRFSASDAALAEIHATSMQSVARGFVLGDNGVTAVAEDGVVVSSNVPDYVGMPFEEIVGRGLRDGFDPQLYDQRYSSEWDMGGGMLSYMRVAQIGYARIAQRGDYQLLVALPATEVFRYRTVLMMVVSLIFLIVFASVYVLAALLLKNVVMRGFDRTNETLSLITGGDLSQVVDVHDSIEFTRLSGGINATVGALRESIEEAEARIARELRTAQAIQENALPNTFPPFPQIDSFDIFATMNPAREVGGDFYDFFLVDDHTLGFLIADVSGKGIPAALFMMAAKTEIGNYLAGGVELAEAIQTANYHLCMGNETGMFVTVWAATFDYESGLLTYVNAGHNPPVLWHDGSWQWLRKRSGLFLGVFEAARYTAHTIQLDPHDKLLLYTDGVTEAFSATDEPYGEERLERVLAEHEDEHPHAIINDVRASIAQWTKGAEQSDDITMLALEYGIAPEATGELTVPATLKSLAQVATFIHDELTRRLCPISVQGQIDVALEELLVNVCNYAYADQDSPGDMRINYVYGVSPSKITIQITDWGIPFNPLEREEPPMITSSENMRVGGLGIFMAKRMVDDLSYIRDNDANVVAFHKVW
ncbi:MAG: SpoIIE family protein phosphatase [Atopobiaceae bacterium]|nr:SpoIIE family protein phosphatase [Atopobiaceae bacterium]